MNSSGWNISFSLLRSLACIAIVVLHTMSYSVVAANAREVELSFSQLLGANIVQYSCMWAVPVFMMVTGALLLNPAKTIPWGALWKRYIARVGTAILVFGALFLAFDLVMNGAEETASNSPFFATHPRYANAGGVVSTGYVILCGLIDLLTGHSWAHMWYLYMLLGLYLLLPFFKMVVDRSSDRELRYLLGVLFLFASVVPLLGTVGVTADYRFSVATVYPLYLFMGYALWSGALALPRWVNWALLAFSTVAVWFSVWRLSGSNQELMSYFVSYNSLPVVLQSASIFALVTGRSRETVKGKVPGLGTKLILAFDRCTFGIYLTHLVFIKLLLRYAGLDPLANVWLFPVVIVGVLLVSWGGTEGYRVIRRKYFDYLGNKTGAEKRNFERKLW